MAEEGTKSKSKPVKSEDRITLVMYGGISLCIYMYGVAREFYNLVQSTAVDGDNELLFPDDGKPLGVKGVYRELAKIKAAERGAKNGGLDSRFVVDIITGTSAGGLNGLFLAKALSANLDLRPLGDLWLNEGDFDCLLNDAKSYKGTSIKQKPPRSLLNGQRMYEKLLVALEQMEKTMAPTGGVCLADQLDLYISATDLKGYPSVIDLGVDDGEAPPTGVSSSDQSAEAGKARERLARKLEKLTIEPFHRVGFHFCVDGTIDEKDEAATSGEKEGVAKPKVNDFARDNLPFLAFVGRCTSSIVPAFEPMRLANAKEVLGVHYKPDIWKDFYRSFWRTAPLLAPLDDSTVAVKNAIQDFPNRSFGDGGYLDNKPFDFAIRGLQNRRADRPVRRKVFYLEPDPSIRDLNDKGNVGESLAPNAFEHAALAITLPGVQTIRQEVSAMRHLSTVSERVRLASKAGTSQATPSLGYYRLRAESVFDNFAQALAKILGFEEDGPFVRPIRAIVQVSMTEQYDLANGGIEKHQEFLNSFDVSFGTRYFEWLRRKFEKSESAKLEKKHAASIAKLNKSFFEKLARGSFAGAVSEVERVMLGLPEDDADGRKLIAYINDLKISIAELAYIRGGQPTVEAGQTDTSDQRTRLVLGYSNDWASVHGIRPKIDSRDEAVRSARKELFSTLFSEVNQYLNLAVVLGEMDAFAVATLGSEIQGPGESFIRGEFEKEDAATYPVIYGTPLNDSYALDIYRISSQDATSIVNTTDEARGKLGGVKMGHFAGFLQKEWRAMDIAWGRLDAAECIIRAYVSPGKVNQLLLNAQLAILSECLEEYGGRDDVRPDVKSGDGSKAREKKLIAKNKTPAGKSNMNEDITAQQIKQLIHAVIARRGG